MGFWSRFKRAAKSVADDYSAADERASRVEGSRLAAAAREREDAWRVSEDQREADEARYRRLRESTVTRSTPARGSHTHVGYDPVSNAAMSAAYIASTYGDSSSSGSSYSSSCDSSSSSYSSDSGSSSSCDSGGGSY